MEASLFVYRRADGTLREFCRERDVEEEERIGSCGRCGSQGRGYGACCVGQRRRHMTRPRNVDRPFRTDGDEPALHTTYTVDRRRSVCSDGKDRTCCSGCGRSVVFRGCEQTTAAHRRTMMSPQRVLRDIVMSDVAEPLRPADRDALLAALDRSVQEAAMSRKARQGPAVDGDDEDSRAKKHTLAEFHLFARLPCEIRRMVWLLAMPVRVLLHSDLAPPPPPPPRGRSAGVWALPHSVHELWQSDLFYTCSEARHIVEEYERGKGRGLRVKGRRGQATNEAVPLARRLRVGVSSDAKLLAGMDVLFYVWQGSKLGTTRTACVGAGVGGSLGGASYALSYVEDDGEKTLQQPLIVLPLPTMALDVAWLDKLHRDSLAWIAGLEGHGAGWEEEREWRPATAAAPPDSVGESGERTHRRRLAPAATASLGTVRFSSEELWLVQVVVADLLVPIAIRLDEGDGGRHEENEDTGNCKGKSYSSGTTDNGRNGSARRGAWFQGMDFTVLVDLYDDWRIDEILSLATPTEGQKKACEHGRQNQGRPGKKGRGGQVDSDGQVDTERLLRCPVNKAAGHFCIGCTRRAWEARDWNRFGLHLGQRLQRLCRPTIVFSVILEVETGEEKSGDGTDEIEGEAGRSSSSNRGKGRATDSVAEEARKSRMMASERRGRILHAVY